ncbi:hypothetical protein DMC30DRAFT_417665 [Rhodotorula diobovata]|uniref:Myb-like domain-containing protein n=1 Tax=Rhodotorula diobovata TaxID=5288 RepID=A0A5C5FTS4_9BASI|nr:hypothetical protein DMC30DRAFT_417665 [Rhodotorula diobovata]
MESTGAPHGTRRASPSASPPAIQPSSDERSRRDDAQAAKRRKVETNLDHTTTPPVASTSAAAAQTPAPTAKSTSQARTSTPAPAPAGSPAASSTPSSARARNAAASSSFARWTDDESRRLIAARTAGLSNAAAAERLGRTVSACAQQWTKLRARDPELRTGNLSQPSGTASGEQADPSSSGPTPPPAPAPAARWRPEEDVEVVTLHAAGWTFDQIGHRLGRSGVACRLRSGTLREQALAIARSPRESASPATAGASPAPARSPQPDSVSASPRLPPFTAPPPLLGAAWTGPAADRALGALRRLRAPGPGPGPGTPREQAATT